jgi:hypothetical protein
MDASDLRGRRLSGPRVGVFKRTANVPRAAESLGSRYSKADLLELVWDYAATTNGVGCDDVSATIARLTELLAANKARRTPR